MGVFLRLWNVKKKQHSHLLNGYTIEFDSSFAPQNFLFNEHGIKVYLSCICLILIEYLMNSSYNIIFIFYEPYMNLIVV